MKKSIKLGGEEMEIVESIPGPKEKLDIDYYMRVAEQSLDEQVDLRKNIDELEKKVKYYKETALELDENGSKTMREKREIEKTVERLKQELLICKNKINQRSK